MLLRSDRLFLAIGIPISILLRTLTRKKRKPPAIVVILGLAMVVILGLALAIFFIREF